MGRLCAGRFLPAHRLVLTPLLAWHRAAGGIKHTLEPVRSFMSFGGGASPRTLSKPATGRWPGDCRSGRRNRCAPVEPRSVVYHAVIASAAQTKTPRMSPSRAFL